MDAKRGGAVALVGVALALVSLAAACGSDPTSTPVATTIATPLPTATATTQATISPTATATPAPTATEPPEAPAGPTPIPGATLVRLEPDRDLVLHSDFPVKANAKGNYLFIGMTNRRDLRRTLLAFDVAGSVPPGATIASARLVLYLSRVAALGDPLDAHVHRATTAWEEGPAKPIRPNEGSGAPVGEGDVTWDNVSFESTPWDTPGGDFVPETSATAVVGARGIGDFPPITWGPTPLMVADVQGWLDDPASNHGWFVLGNEEVQPSAKRFQSRENAEESQRPELIIEYMPPA